VLGAQVSDTVKALAPVGCAIDTANIDNANYAQAGSDALQGFPFSGVPKDDLTKPANRIRVFRARLDELQAQRKVLAGITPKSSYDEELTQAAREDVRAALAQTRYSLKYAPDAANSPPSPDAPANNLDGILSDASGSIQKAFGDCKIPADVQRRQQAYGT
jgi:hypothetical protein